MDKQKRQEINTGNGVGEARKPESAKRSTGEKSRPSQASIGNGQNATKPVSVSEALSLWQTACFDLQSSGFKLAIVTRNNRIYLIAEPLASIGEVTLENGHFKIDGLPVSDRDI